MEAMSSLILLGLVLCVAVALVWTIWSAVALLFFKQKVRGVLWGFPFSVVVVLFAFGGLWFHQSRPSTIFEHEFGFAVPPDTQVLNGASSVLGDSGSGFLYFRPSPAALQRILSSGFQLDNQNALSTHRGPAWYRPATGPAVQVYRTNQLKPKRPSGFSSEQYTIIYDPVSGEAWYSFEGID